MSEKNERKDNAKSVAKNRRKTAKYFKKGKGLVTIGDRSTQDNLVFAAKSCKNVSTKSSAKNKPTGE